MSSFTALMALSATQTREAQSQAEMILREKKRKEQLARKQQEEREAKERELERKMRLKHFEEEKKEQERKRRREEEEKAKEAALKKREDEQRRALLYGPKKTAKASGSAWPTSTSGVKESVRKHRFPEDDDSDVGGGGGLTREELRQRKQQQEYRRLYGSSGTKRTSHSSGYSKQGRRLPGGAVDVSSSSVSQDSSSGKGIKERLASMPNTLTKLNTVKRDTRTIDEILQDRAKLREGKVLDGDAAREFDDWFGTKKKDTRKTSPATRPSSASGTNTPASQSATSWPTPVVSSSSSLKKSTIVAPKPVAASRPTPLKTSGLAKSGPSSSTPKSAGPSKQGTSSSHKSALSVGKIPKNGSSANDRPGSAAAHHKSSSSLKRPRSVSRSESPPPQKRRALSDDLGTDIGQEIWKLFGRDRAKYISRDVMSDDEDMEADARILEEEEKRSMKVAKQEDMAALEEERRREEEKRRRKKERERQLARGS